MVVPLVWPRPFKPKKKAFSDMDVEVEVVNDLVRTKRGKVLHLVQKLNLDEFK